MTNLNSVTLSGLELMGLQQEVSRVYNIIAKTDCRDSATARFNYKRLHDTTKNYLNLQLSFLVDDTVKRIIPFATTEVQAVDGQVNSSFEVNYFELHEILEDFDFDLFSKYVIQAVENSNNFYYSVLISEYNYELLNDTSKIKNILKGN